MVAGERPVERRIRVVGRELELAALRECLLAPSPGALLLTGAAGIGKRTLWEAGLEAARDRGLRILAARPSDGEAQVSFSVLGDLLEELDSGALAGISPPLAAGLAGTGPTPWSGAPV